jgi:single-stranded-DNA-specific exonuclease RecJ
VQHIWQFRGNSQENTEFSKDVLAAAEGSPLLAKLLANRGITTPEAIRTFLDLEAYQPRSGLELPDMPAAVARILKALEAQESILIYGDFDVDGITGTSILYETFKKHLNAKVSFYIPDRATEGHGLNSAALIRLTSSRQVKLVITTDTGITNFSEVSLLNGLGVDTIVTDHHALPENLPPAVANVNSQRTTEVEPNHPMHHLCGAGVAYKLCELLLERLLPVEQAARAKESLLDIVAVGTVVDMVPLVDENRWLVYRGLQVLNQRKRLGFNQLLEQAGVKADAPITSETIGFTIGPRLNALGRLERADQGVELLTTDNPERARIIAAHLEFLNRKRRELCDQTFLEAETHLQASGGLGDNKAIILASPDWNPGIIGIVGSRLIEKYHVPVFMMVVDEAKAQVRCSGRSIPGFHLHDELLALEHYFLNFGGHGGAGGFSLKLEHLEAFKRDLHALCRAKITEEQMRPVITVDAKLEWSQVNPHLVSLIQKLAPCGMSNPSPKFVIENVNVAAQRSMGEDNRHIKLVLTNGEPHKSASNTPLEGIIWNFGNKERFDARSLYDFVVSPELNTFNGVTKVQLLIEDYKTPKAAKTTTETVSVSPLSTVQTKAAASIPAETPLATTCAERESGPQWIDHRGRDDLDAYVSQLTLSLREKKQVIFYHEGKKPGIPFIEEHWLFNRRMAQPAEELILWDLPPSALLLNQLLNTVKPEVIHLIGGKYQTVPVFPSALNYLKLILQVLRREGEQCAIQPELVATQLAMTPDVILLGLVLLEKLGLLKAKYLPEEKTTVQIHLLPGGSALQLPPEWLEVKLFGKALQEVGKFRGWLLKTGLATIKSTLKSPWIMMPDSTLAEQTDELRQVEYVVRN